MNPEALTTSRPLTPGMTPGLVKLLLVDDDPDNLLALQAILEPLGQELMLATSGPDALRLCLENEFAAILLDVRMPGMDGFETAELIRSRKSSRRTPILFLTGYRSDEQLFRGYDLGAVDFLFKPIVPEILQSKVTVFVELCRSEQLLRQQAQAVARTEQRFRAVLEAAPDAMVITDEHGVIRLANSRTDALFGYPREQLLGTKITSLIPDWEPPNHRNGNAKSEDSGEGSALLEARLNGVRRGGSVFTAEITRSPFDTHEGLLITTAIRDATDQVAAEERVRRINVELEKRVEERTLDLTRSNEALRQFAWAASHDLQEATRMILTYSQWILRSAGERLDPENREKLACVEENGARLQTLLAALREYIYISESGAPNWTATDCNAVVRTAVSHLDGVIAESGATVVCENLPVIESAEILLLQLFQNLIGNALKYRSDEPPHVRVSAFRRDNAWVFCIEDNGIGIQPQYLDYIFGVFKRLHNRQYSGAGIGLAICKAAVERLGGRIWVESTPGRGSAFQFELPAKIAH
ncbi:MAG: response regulator [Acidobacteriaceae bacterium]|nr:response regulator [Acidobacteriaceae bacterium]